MLQVNSELLKFPSFDSTVRQTTQSQVPIHFSTSPIKEHINKSIDISENTMEYFSKNVNYIIVFLLNNREKPLI